VSFSRLLLVAASSKKYIMGEGNDKVIISPKLINSGQGRDIYEGEVILCFQLDERTDREKRVSKSLGIAGDQARCDGLVFYSQDGIENRVICLVEMKSTDIQKAAHQLIATKQHIEGLLRQECDSLLPEYRQDSLRHINRIKWKACMYHHGASSDDLDSFFRELRDARFEDFAAVTLADNDLRHLLSGEGRSAREMGMKFKSGKHGKRR
jgi:hypothetical protein